MTRVIKLGGSLLQWRRWPQAFHGWLGQQPAAANLVIVGGGVMVDAIRQLTAHLEISADTPHWAAIRAMTVTAQLAAAALGDVPIIHDWNGLTTIASESACQILDVERCLRQARGERWPDELPASWDVTSDSIAAWVARRCHAEELVLLKSVSLPAKVRDFREAAARGLVDAYFPHAAGGLDSVRWINLRQPQNGRLLVTQPR